MLWAVANTLTVFAIRNVGLSIAFPLWNTNSLVGLFWGWLLFNELRGAGSRQWAKVLGGAGAIVVGACLLAYATSHQAAPVPGRAAALGIVAALGAGVLWGTMYIPYRKAYISGMNPLSFVTVFTFGELATVFALAVAFDGGVQHVAAELGRARPALFWLFLGGFCWVLGDLFQQYAAKYIGISRGIPLSNTNQLWGLAWGALVFGELAGLGLTAQMLVIAGSLIMIAGAIAISLAEAPQSEQASWRKVTRAGMRPVRLGSRSRCGRRARRRSARRRKDGPPLVGVADRPRRHRDIHMAGFRRGEAADRGQPAMGSRAGRCVARVPGRVRRAALETDALLVDHSESGPPAGNGGSPAEWCGPPGPRRTPGPAIARPGGRARAWAPAPQNRGATLCAGRSRTARCRGGIPARPARAGSRLPSAYVRSPSACALPRARPPIHKRESPKD